MGLKYKQVIWDWNGTLIDDAIIAHTLCNKVLQQSGFPPLSFEDYQRNMTHPLRNLFSNLGISISSEAYQNMATLFAETYMANLADCHLFSDVEDTLKLFQELGLSQGIVSALSHSLLLESVQAKGIERYFSSILGLSSNDAGSKIATALKYVEQLAVNSNEIFVVGDTCHDFEVAKAIGCDCYLIARGMQHIDNLKETGANVFNSLVELRNFLLSK